MKQKHLLRPPVWLASLLLIVVMAIGGSTAWAQDPTADFQDLGLATTGVKTLNGVTVNFQAQTGYGAPEICKTSDVVTFSCDAGKAIVKIQFYNISPYDSGTIDVTADGVSTPMSYQKTSTWTWEGSALSVEFKGHGDADMLFRGVKVWLEDTAPAEPIEYTMNIVGAPVGASVTLDGQMMTNGSTYTVAKNLTTNDVTATPVEGYFVTKDYNATTHTFTVTSVAGQEGAYNFKGEIPFTRGGVASTLKSGNNLAENDVFTAEGSTLTFTAVSSSWSNSAERLKLGSGTAFTLAAPEGYHITEIVFNTDANNLNGLTATSGLTKNSNTKATWTGEEESVAFSITADTWIQTIALKMISVIVDPVDYTVVINNAPEGANITLNGQAITANGTYTIAKTLSLTDLVVANIAGYNVDKTYNADTHTFTVTFTEIPHYTVHITGPNGLYFTIAGEAKSWSDGAIIETDGTITEDDIVFSNSMYDMEKRVEGTDIYLTITAKTITYTVNIAGGPDDATIKITNPTTWMAGTYKNGDVVEFNQTIDADYVEATLPLYTSSVQVTSNAVNVTYTALESYNYYVTYTGQVPSAPAVTVGGASVQQYPGYDDFIYLNEPLTAEAVATGASGYDIEVTSIEHPYDTTFGRFTVNFTKQPVYTSVTSVSPSWTEQEATPDDPYGTSLHYFTINFADNVSADFGTYSSHALPEGCTFTTPDGEAELDYLQAWNGGANLSFATKTNHSAEGTYTFHFPAGVIQFEGDKVNPELNYTWTITPCTSFAIDSWNGVEAIGEQGADQWSPMKSVTGFKVLAPEGHLFAFVDDSEVTLSVREGYDGVATDVTAAVELDTDGNAVFTFPEAYTEKCNLYVTIPRGVITDTNSLVNKEIEASFNIDPNTYFSIESCTPTDGASVVGPVDEIVITLPEGMEAQTVGTTIELNGEDETVTPTINGNKVTLTLTNPMTDAVAYNRFVLPEGLIVTTDGAISYAQYVYNVEVTVPIMITRVEVNGVEATSGVNVEKLDDIAVYFSNGVEYQWDPAGRTFTNVATGDPVAHYAYTNAYNSATYLYENLYFYGFNLETPGIYRLYMPAGMLSYGGKDTQEFTFDIVIPEPVYFAEPTFTPAAGEVESLESFTITAPEGVTFDKTKGLKNGRITIDDNEWAYTNSVQFAEDGKSVTFKVSKVTADGSHTVVLPAGLLTSTDGEKSPEMTRTYTVSYPYFPISSYDVMNANPREAKSIATLTIPQSYNYDTYEAYDFDDMATLDVTIDGVKTACAVAETVDGDLTITLPTAITAVGTHTFAIAAGAITANEGLLSESAVELSIKVLPTLVVDETGWTTFCLDNAFTLEDGYTPYIVVAGEGDNIAYKELLGTPKTEDINVHMDGSFGTDNTLTVSGNTMTAPVLNDKVQVTFGGSFISEGSYYDAYEGAYVDVVSIDPSIEIGNVDAYSWSSDFDSYNYNATPIAGGVRLTWTGFAYFGGLKVGLATGEYNKPIVPANTGILIQGAAKADVTYAKASGTTADVTGNLLRECGESATWSAEGETYFDLANGLFQKVGSSIAAEAGKAYLVRTGVDEYHIGYDADGAPVIAAIAITDKTTSAVTYLAPKAGDDIQLNDAGVSKVVITEPIENVNVTYTRNFKNANAWVSWYVPFTINAAANNNAVFAKLVTVTYADNTGKVVADPADGTLTFILSRLSTEDVKANTPYFVYVKEAGDYDFTADALEMTRVKSIDCSTVDYKFTFEGAYEPYFGNAEGTCIGLSTSGKYITVKEDQSLAPYRWHCLVESRDNLYNNIDPALIEGARILVIGEDAEATAILNALTDQQNANTYDLQGRAVQRMNQGVYVKDGKKVLNK